MQSHWGNCVGHQHNKQIAPACILNDFFDWLIDHCVCEGVIVVRWVHLCLRLQVSTGRPTLCKCDESDLVEAPGLQK